VHDQLARRNFGKKIELVEKLICSHESALNVYKNPKLEGRWTFHGRLFGVLQLEHDVRLKIYKRLSGLL